VSSPALQGARRFWCILISVVKNRPGSGVEVVTDDEFQLSHKVDLFWGEGGLDTQSWDTQDTHIGCTSAWCGSANLLSVQSTSRGMWHGLPCQAE